ncbi:MAG: GTPase domain-containing protein [Acidobacteriota bacterium]
MALIDPTTGQLKLHIVYDGAPKSGKTTTLHALARRYGLEVETPEERNGRTVYFDWMDFVGGRVRDLPIRCRVIAVPGQDELAARRATILEAADAVIFVVDTRREHAAKSREHFEELQTLLRARMRPIPVLAQLNKRDADDTLDVDELKSLFGPGSVHLIETVATDGDGVQQAFALGISEAVRSVRGSNLSRAGGLQELTGIEVDLGDPRSLLDRLLSQAAPKMGVETT